VTDTATDFAQYQAALKKLRGMAPVQKAQPLAKITEACLQAEATQDMLKFNDYTWQLNSPYLAGRHTIEIAQALDDAIARFYQGKSTYMIVTLPFRHGKSQIVSRSFPPYVFGRLQEYEPEIILSTYGQDLSDEMSRDAQEIVKSEEYKELFPTITIDPRRAGVQNWRINDSNAKLTAVGLQGAAIGKGAHVLIIDDYLKGRENATSEVIRNKTWQGFIDLMTRLAPVHIVAILATRWHVDDVIGRIQNKNNPKHEDFQPSFPKFNVLKYPARYDDGSYLFPERMGEDWYKTQFGTLPPFRIASELQGDPTIPGGNMIKTDNIHFNAEMPDDLLYCRSWDLASTEQERNSDDPDYTLGLCVAVRQQIVRDLMGKTILDDEGEPTKILTIYIEDGRYCREEAPRRDALIRATALEDGAEVWQGTESVAGYKDKYTILKKTLEGVRVVRKITLRGDKVTRAAILEPVFLVGNVYINGHPDEDPWVALLIKHLSEFPNGAHDDGVDALVNGVSLCLQRYAEYGMTGEVGESQQNKPYHGGDDLWDKAAV
jgi:predicted phage terminase large subunit-like protein